MTKERKEDIQAWATIVAFILVTFALGWGFGFQHGHTELSKLGGRMWGICYYLPAPWQTGLVNQVVVSKNYPFKNWQDLQDFMTGGEWVPWTPPCE